MLTAGKRRVMLCMWNREISRAIVAYHLLSLNRGISSVHAIGAYRQYLAAVLCTQCSAGLCRGFPANWSLISFLLYTTCGATISSIYSIYSVASFSMKVGRQQYLPTRNWLPSSAVSRLSFSHPCT